MDESGRRQSIFASCLTVLAATAGLTAFFLIGASSLVLSEPDEARCALIAHHMIDSGDWLAPQLLDRPYFDKPPLFFWMLAGCMKAFPASAWALRLTPALVCAATIVLTGILAAQLFNRRAGLLAAGTFAVSIAALMGSRIIRMDMLLALWVTGALICWSRVYLLGKPRWWYALMYVCMALGCLTKGPIAVFLPALIIGIHMALDILKTWHSADNSQDDNATAAAQSGTGNCVKDHTRADKPPVAPEEQSLETGTGHSLLTASHPSLAARHSPVAALFSMHIPLGVAIIAVLYGSWVAYMTWRYPQYLSEFFVKQNLGRFAGSGLGIITSRFTVLASYIAGLMPWAPLMAAAAWQLRPRRDIPASQKFLWIWGLTVIVFFSLSKVQFPNYVLPAFPSTFALLGAYLVDSHLHRRQVRLGLILTFALAGTGVIAWPFVERKYVGHIGITLAVGRVAGLLLLAGLTVWLWKRRPQAALVPLLLGCALFVTQMAGEPARRVLASRSYGLLAQPLRNLDPSAGPVIMATEPLYSVVYYAPPGWTFRFLDKVQAVRQLPALLGADRDVYAVLTGGYLLETLTGANDVGVEVHGQPVNLTDRLTILAVLPHEGGRRDVLVRISPQRNPQQAPATQASRP